MKDIMLDIETFGSTKNAPICQIGACYFDRITGEIGERFFENVDAKVSFDKGFSVSGNSIYWWLEQSEKARKGLLIDLVYPQVMLTKFNDFIKKDGYIWSHATFDFIVLMNHYDVYEIKPKFNYRNARDLRTLVDLCKKDINLHQKSEFEGVKHNALDDCLKQVRYATMCFRHLVGMTQLGTNLSYKLMPV